MSGASSKHEAKHQRIHMAFRALQYVYLKENGQPDSPMALTELHQAKDSSLDWPHLLTSSEPKYLTLELSDCKQGHRMSYALQRKIRHFKLLLDATTAGTTNIPWSAQISFPEVLN